MAMQERYSPQILAANATSKINGGKIGGFICTVSGTLTIFEPDGATKVLDSFPVTAGVYHPLPMGFAAATGYSVVLSGGAAGTLLR